MAPGRTRHLFLTLLLYTASTVASSPSIVLSYTSNPPINARLIKTALSSDVAIDFYADLLRKQPADFDFTQDLFSGWNDPWIGIALESFDASFEVDIELAEGAEGDLAVSLFKKSISHDGLDATIDVQVYMVASTQAPMSFTAGLDLQLQKPAAIMIPGHDVTQSQSIGFEPGDIALTPIFNASIPKLDFDVQLSLRTVFSISVDKLDITLAALIFDVPAFNLTVTSQNNVLSNCQTPPLGTPSDQIYPELTKFHGDLFAQLSYDLLNETGTIKSWSLEDSLNECYAFLPGLGHIGAVPNSSKSPLLTATPVVTCTTEGAPSSATLSSAIRALSPGATAGAIVGTVAGIAIIFFLACCAGRRSQRHKNKAHRASPAGKCTSVKARNSFSRFHRRRNQDYASVTPETPIWQAPTHAEDYFAISSTEMHQQHFPNQAWDGKKSRPTTNMRELISPASTYVPSSNDYGPPRNGDAEDGDTCETFSSTLTGKKGFVAGQNEGLDLYNGDDRFIGQQKLIARKPLPGSLS